MQREIGIKLFLNNEDLGNKIINIDNNFDNNTFNIFKRKIFVFMSNELYNSLNDKQKLIISDTAPDEEDLNIDDMFNKDVMTFLFDNSEINEGRQEILELADLYIGDRNIDRKLYNILIKE